ncbi:exonuclease domain-containing protein [Candidatus Phytoplasma sp. AldY-WA1]|uniref:exonuclease domain-containing protein n=1 Tax=Candidatus Phytoplasma sp. AldY-WA1 TaxID=2852100 RepID=UPI00254B92B0|nr:exonuclease domain-containing protein [Candidatus Phytoplasma sp. AldY-WA1]
MSSNLISDKFIKFIDDFNKEKQTNYEFVQTIVSVKKIKWVLEFSGDKNLSNISCLNDFEQSIKQFINEKTNDLMKYFKNFKIVIRFLFTKLDNIQDESLWKELFQYLLNKIIKSQSKKGLFSILNSRNGYNYDIEILKIDFEKKICHIKITFNQYSSKCNEEELKSLIQGLDQLLKERYGSDLSLNIKEIKFLDVPEEKNNDKFFLTFDDIPKSYEQVKDLQPKKFWIKGYIQQVIKKETKNKQILFSFYLVDPKTKKDSILYRIFAEPNSKEYQKMEKCFQEGVLVEIFSSLNKIYNAKYKEDFNFKIENEYRIVNSTPFFLERIDDYPGKKRIEFHLHTKMSNLDATNSAKDYIDTAIRWGHEAIAFTDHHGLYAYPEIDNCTRKKPIKPILGVETDFIEEKPIFITNQEEHPKFEDFVLKKHNYVVFDIETTGFSECRDRIIEIAAVKIENGQITDKIFNELVNPKVKLNKNIIELTKIQDEDLENKPTIEEILPKFLEFIQGYVLVAHNLAFDIGFIKEKAKNLKIPFIEQPCIDTLRVSQRYFEKNLKYFSLKRVAKCFKIKTELEGSHHRALYDSTITALVLIEMFKRLEEQEIFYFYDLRGRIDGKFEISYHINILAKNQIGYKNLFHLVSHSLTKDFYRKPRLLKSNLEKYREGLLVGSGCAEGNVFQTALNKNDKELSEVISFYDYIEVQPIDSYKHIIYNLVGDNTEKGKIVIQETILKIINEAQKQNKIVIATGDVHYLNPYDKIYREIYINAKLVGGGLHNLSKYPTKYLPDNYFLTTQEMLDAFDFIEDQKLKEDLVINNTHLLNDQIEKIRIFPKKLFSLKDDNFAKNLNIPSIKIEMQNLIENKLQKLYGKKLHPFIQQRMEKELKSIIGDGKDKNINQNIAPIYFLAYLLTKESIGKGYPVGSRGSIGSSLIATILGITEVNPLKPHYFCPQCQYTVFPQMTPEQKESHEYKEYIQNQGSDLNDYSQITDILSGYDLPDINCPFCSVKFSKDGQDIPFETFLGFEGNKTPDIDLNFAGDYQPKAHEYMRELLGHDCVFRAGTIQTVAKQTAFGYVKGFIKEKELEDKIRNCEISRISNIIEGVKRSTGQHPGGIVVVPPNISVYEVTPIQFPANDIESNWKTTHFDYHSFENNLFKMDILGHDDPILIKFFMDYVEKNQDKFSFTSYQNIPVDDPNVYKLFSNEYIDKGQKIATIAIPEFGTTFVQKMLKDICEKNQKINFGILVKVSGLSHGTDVWLQNSQDILEKRGDFDYLKKSDLNISFNDIIGCRDDIMLYLIRKNVDPLKSFEIMELVRKGKQHSKPGEWEEMIESIKKETDIHDWYFESLGKIKYLFPKAHASAYVLMAVRIAWFKVHHPLLFYSGVLSTRLDQFDYDLMLKNQNEIDEKINTLLGKNIKQKNTTKEQSLINTLNIASEMLRRGFKFLPIDLNKSEAYEFVMYNNDSLIMPFITIDGLGEKAAKHLVEERKEKLFTQADFKKRAKLNKTISKKIIEELKLVEKLPL